MSKVLTDREIMELCDMAPCAENDGLAELADEADVIVKAAASYIHTLDNPQERIVFAMRAFYLLGVQRGGEAYRMMQDAIGTVRPALSFSLCDVYEEEIVDDLKEIGRKYLNTICRQFGFVFADDGGVSLV